VAIAVLVVLLVVVDIVVVVVTEVGKAVTWKDATKHVQTLEYWEVWQALVA
jgi:hypothetical protein